MEDNRFKKVIINSPVPEEGVVTGDSLEEAAPFIQLKVEFRLGGDVATVYLLRPLAISNQRWAN